MHKKTLLLVASLFLVAFVIQSASAYTSWYGYDNGYKNEYYVKDAYDYNGHTYTQRQISQTPTGEKTTYTQIKDYNNYASPYQNTLSNYWAYGPQGYSYTFRNRDVGYLDYSYDDAYLHSYYGSNYHPYYYQNYPYFNGQYYNWNSCHNVYC